MSTKSIVGIVAVLALIGGGYAYHSTHNEGKNIFSDILSGEQEIKKEPISYSFNAQFDAKVTQKGEEEKNINIAVKNAGLYVKNAGLNERIVLEKGNFSITGGESFEVKNIDFISDNEKVYLKGNVGRIKDFLSVIPQFQAINHIQPGSYIQIDNSKPFLKMLGSFAQNELIKELTVGMTTANPMKYYIQHKTGEKVIAYLQSDKIINFVFKDGEYDKKSKKTFLVLNERLCEFSEVMQNIDPELLGAGTQINNLKKQFVTNNNMHKKCLEELKQANSFLGMLNLYKQGDSKSGDYTFVLQQGNLVNISIGYQKHNLSDRSIALADPFGKVNIKANGNTQGIVSSFLQLNINDKGLKISGKIEDGTGKITLEETAEFPGKINGIVSLSSYKIKSYKLNSEIGTLKITAQGNNNEGDINITSGEDVQEKIIFNLKYKENFLKSTFTGEGVKFDIDYQNEILKILLKSMEINIDGYIDKNKTEISGNFGDILNASGKNMTIFELQAHYSNIFETNYVIKINSPEFNLDSKGDVLKRYIDLNAEVLRRNGKKEAVINFIGDYAQKKMNLHTVGYNYNGEEDEIFNFDYTQGKIKGDFSNNAKKEYVYIGNFTNIGEFNIDMEFPQDDTLIKIVGKKVVDTFTYTLDVTIKKEQIGKTKIEVTVKNNTITSKGTIFAKNELDMSYNFSLDYTKGGVEYVIPTEFETVDVSIMNTFILPDLSMRLQESFNYNEFYNIYKPVVFITAGAVIGTFGYIFYQGFLEGMNDAKGIPPVSDVILDSAIHTVQ